jgi:hypothetical protein
MKILNIKKNCMGTLSFDAKFNGMRKPQDFIVYPMHKDQATDKIKIQSDTRIGYIYLETGDIVIAGPVSSGAYNPHLIFAKKIDALEKDELAGLKFRLFQTADPMAGNRCVHTDNSNADKVKIF